MNFVRKTLEIWTIFLFALVWRFTHIWVKSEISSKILNWYFECQFNNCRFLMSEGKNKSTPNLIAIVIFLVLVKSLCITFSSIYFLIFLLSKSPGKYTLHLKLKMHAEYWPVFGQPRRGRSSRVETVGKQSSFWFLLCVIFVHFFVSNCEKILLEFVNFEGISRKAFRCNSHKFGSNFDITFILAFPYYS